MKIDHAKKRPFWTVISLIFHGLSSQVHTEAKYEFDFVWNGKVKHILPTQLSLTTHLHYLTITLFAGLSSIQKQNSYPRTILHSLLQLLSRSL